MAELILTDEEKAQTYLGMEDEALGKYCKAIMCKLNEAHEERHKWEMLSIAMAAMLVDQSIQVNAATSEYKFDGFSIADKEHGDWVVKVTQK